jgi:hypothetical protein
MPLRTLDVESIFLPLGAGNCPTCGGRVNGITFGESDGSMRQLRPCGDFVDLGHARLLLRGLLGPLDLAYAG